MGGTMRSTTTRPPPPPSVRLTWAQQESNGLYHSSGVHHSANGIESDLDGPRDSSTVENGVSDDNRGEERNGSLVGHRMQAVRSVLALVVDQGCVFAGLQGGDIVAWSLETYELVLSVKAHQESVLGLFLSEDGNLLFSSGGDSVVNVWSTRTFERLYSIYSHHDVGDIFTVVYSSDLKTIYCGAQNTSIQWLNLQQDADPLPDFPHPSKRTHKFFDSKGPGGIPAPKYDSFDGLVHGGQTLTFRRDHHRLFAHHGYVYCMLLVRGLLESRLGAEVLLTGSGDGSVKLWNLEGEAPVEMFALKDGDESVLSMAVDGPFLYCGLSDGAVNIWNLDSRQIIKKITSQSGDVWALDIVNGITLCGDSSGVVKKFNSLFEEIGSWTAHDGTMLASAAAVYRGRRIYATGGNDNTVAIWDLTEHPTETHEIPAIGNDEMVNCLAKYVGFKTISSRPKFAVECNQGAAFLRRHCGYLGAQTKLLSTGPSTNPIVFARFDAVSKHSVDKTLLFYGHYDVVGPESTQKKWKTDPFQLTSINGYLYGRGVSDNKGPTLAALYAAAELTKTKKLACNIVFLIEGEEESGSQGFSETVQANKDLIGDVYWILLANSYWLDDHIPCLTYGLRGVVHANLIVSSRHPDLHSGIDGSSLLDEPLKDLTMLLGTLVGRKGKINLPGFHDAVLPLTDAERKRYDAIAEALLPLHPEIEDCESFKDSLMHRWREPSLTIHSVDSPGCKSSSTTISRKAKASLSIRLVPNQNVDEVAASLIDYCQSQFAELESQNTLTVEITGKADPWLGDPENDLFKTLSRAITYAWSSGKSDRHHTYSFPDRTRRLPKHELERTDSSESIASHVERIIASSTSAPRSVGHSTLSKNLLPRPSVPTSSTLADSTDRTHTPAESDTHSPIATPTALSTIKSKATQPYIPPHSPTSSSHSSSSQHSSYCPSSDPRRQQQPQSQPPRPLKPILIREGGSIPTIRFLEKTFNAPAAHLPCGQASDNAHLDNERLRVENLYKSREIFLAVFQELGKDGRTDESESSESEEDNNNEHHGEGKGEGKDE
ncbi:hypothetical protein VTO42DRAFT_297 [Malbranchea cinnamomea]